MDNDPPVHKRRVLVAEDEESVRLFIKSALEAAGYETVAVPDAHAALRVLKKRHFDLLITDVLMPEIDGVTLSLKASADFPEMKILMITGYSDQRERAYNLEQMIDAVLDKPFTMEELCALVQKILQ